MARVAVDPACRVRVGTERPARGRPAQDRSKEMTRIVLTEFISLDGVIEEPRWTFQFERGPEGSQFKWDELFDSEALLLARVTYEGVARACPNKTTDAFVTSMKRIPKNSG